MILRNSLYEISAMEMRDGLPVYSISLNADCPIYKVHFPGSPVTPGVCIVQMVEELLEDYLERKVTLSEVKNVKFLYVLSPEETTNVECYFQAIEINDASHQVSVKASVSSTAHVFSTLSFVCNI
jgi:3-hydroxyacyl-[acyl-carrier-protein] dehydratase